MTEANVSASRRSVAVGVVVYRPDPGLRLRMQFAADAGFEVYVFDNSPEESATRDFVRPLVRFHYCTCGQNVGLGVGISAVCAQAYYDGAQALIFFDQDTVFDARTLGFVASFHDAHGAMGRDYSAVVFKAGAVVPSNPAGAPVRDVRMAISSGTMFFLEKLKAIGWHNPRYFVDCVDYEFCLRTEQHGLKIGECGGTPGFDHASEQPDHVRRVLGRDHAVRRYAASRVRQTVGASLRLAVTAALAGRFGFALAMLRSLSIYVIFQIVPRLPWPARQ